MFLKVNSMEIFMLFDDERLIIDSYLMDRICNLKHNDDCRKKIPELWSIIYEMNAIEELFIKSQNIKSYAIERDALMTQIQDYFEKDHLEIIEKEELMKILSRLNSLRTLQEKSQTNTESPEVFKIREKFKNFCVKIRSIPNLCTI